MLFQYEWSLVNTTAVAPSGGKMENGQEKMTVSGLGQGSYSFKVVVTGSDPRAEGEGLGVVTVLPRESADGARSSRESLRMSGVLQTCIRIS